MPQDDSTATHAAKISKKDGQIDWRKSADELDRQIRAFTPWPGSYTRLSTTQKSLLKILGAQVADGAGSPGQILASENGQFEVATGQGSLILTSVQREGARTMAGPDFLNGCPLPPGAGLK